MIGARFFRDLVGEKEGVTAVEFGFVAPVLMVIIMGVFDVAHTQYTSSLVHGAMQKAGRDLTLEGATQVQADIDATVVGQISKVTPSTATVTLEKLSHFDFSDIGEAEEFEDDDGDGACNNGERYVDQNGNGQWDANRGQDGIGGARDAVLYTAVVTYPRLFPMAGLAGLPENVELRSSTVLRNQPFASQDRSTTTGTCA